MICPALIGEEYARWEDSESRNPSFPASGRHWDTGYVREKRRRIRVVKGSALTLFYDGGCNLCDVSQLRAKRWADRAGVVLRGVALQDPEAVGKGYGAAMVLETPDAIFTGADAWMELVRRVGPWYVRPFGWMARTAPTRALARFGYGIVERNRIRWFGSKVCAIPTRPAPEA